MSLIGHATHYFEGLWSSGSELRNGGPAFGVLQRCSRSGRIVAACLLIAAVTLTKSLAVLTCIYLVCAIGALLSFIEIRRYLGRNLVIVCGLALPMAVFGSLAIVTPGVTFLRIGRVHFTHQGVRNVAFVVMRSLDAVSITMLLARSCGIHGIIKGLREMGLPAELTAALQMAVAHMHSLGRMAASMMQSFRCRTIKPPSLKNVYSVTGTQGAVLLRKSLSTSREVHSAMLARGFTGHFPQVDQPRRWGVRDGLLLLACAIILTIAILW